MGLSVGTSGVNYNITGKDVEKVGNFFTNLFLRWPMMLAWYLVILPCWLLMKWTAIGTWWLFVIAPVWIYKQHKSKSVNQTRIEGHDNRRVAMQGVSQTPNTIRQSKARHRKTT